MALASLDVLRQLDDRLTLATLVGRLADRQAAALAVVGEVDDLARARADDLDLPLLALPPETGLHELDQAITRTIYERRSQLYQLGIDVHQQLVALSLSGRGLPAIVGRLADITGRAIVLQSVTGQVEHCARPGGSPYTPEEAAAGLARAGPALGGREVRSALAAEPLAQRVVGRDFAGLVAPVATPGGAVAHLWLLGPDDELDDADRVAVGRASLVCTLELAKEQAVVDAEQRLRGDFLDELLQGRASDAAVTARARHLGYDLARPHALLVARPGPVREPGRRGPAGPEALASLARDARRWLASRAPSAPVFVHAGALVVLCPLGEPPDPGEARAVAEQLVRRVAGDPPLAVGLSRHYPGPDGIRTAYREAERALAIGSHLARLAPDPPITAFADLGIYRLLFALRDDPELAAFCRESLAALTGYDAANGAELTHTLEAFFAHGASLQATAEALSLHRNSLAYRLHRIEDVAGVSLDNPEDRLRLQVALKARQVLAGGEGHP